MRVTASMCLLSYALAGVASTCADMGTDANACHEELSTEQASMLQKVMVADDIGQVRDLLVDMDDVELDEGLDDIEYSFARGVCDRSIPLYGWRYPEDRTKWDWNKEKLVSFCQKYDTDLAKCNDAYMASQNRFKLAYFSEEPVRFPCVMRGSQCKANFKAGEYCAGFCQRPDALYGWPDPANRNWNEAKKCCFCQKFDNNKDDCNKAYLASTDDKSNKWLKYYSEDPVRFPCEFSGGRCKANWQAKESCP